MEQPVIEIKIPNKKLKYKHIMGRADMEQYTFYCNEIMKLEDPYINIPDLTSLERSNKLREYKYKYLSFTIDSYYRTLNNRKLSINKEFIKELSKFIYINSTDDITNLKFIDKNIIDNIRVTNKYFYFKNDFIVYQYDRKNNFMYNEGYPSDSKYFN